MERTEQGPQHGPDPDKVAADLCAGRITGAHGIRGWVKVHSYTDPATNLLDYGEWRLKPGAGIGGGSADRGVTAPAASVKVLAGKMQGKALLAQLDGVTDRNQAEALRGREIWIGAEQLPALDEGDYYWRDLIGLRVVTEYEGSTALLGEVDHLIETGANDVLVLRPCEGSIDHRERLLPYLPGSVVTGVSLGAGEMRVQWHPQD